MIIDPDFFSLLNQLLERCPASVESLVRTAAHNQAVGGAAGSGHVKGCAADLSFDTPSALYAAAGQAIGLGFMGVELDLINNHLHVDTLPRMWRVVHTRDGEKPLEAFLAAKN